MIDGKIKEDGRGFIGIVVGKRPQNPHADVGDERRRVARARRVTAGARDDPVDLTRLAPQMEEWMQHCVRDCCIWHL